MHQSRFLATGLAADPEGMTFWDAAGNQTRVTRGIINRIIWRGPELWIERLGDIPVILDSKAFDAAAALGPESSGDHASDFTRILEGVRFYAPQLEVEIDRSPRAIDFGDAPAWAVTSPPMEIDHDPYGQGEGAAPTFERVRTGDLELDAIRPSARQPAPTPESEYYVPPVPPPATSGYRDPSVPACLNCDKVLADAPQHFLISDRAWCVECASPLVAPALVVVLWFGLRAALVVVAGERTYALMAGLRQPIILAVLAATLVCGLLLFLLFVWARTDSISGTVERRLGPPGAGGQVIPAGIGLGWLGANLRQSVAPLILAVVISGGVVGASVFNPATPFPKFIPGFLDRDLEKFLTQEGRDKVVFAQYAQIGQPPAEATRFIVLARGPLPAPEIVKRVMAEFGRRPDYEATETRSCALSQSRSPLANFYMTKPCGEESCVAYARKIRDIGPSGGYDIDCYDTLPYQTLEWALGLEWAQP